MTTVDIRAAERPGATPPRFGHAAPNIDVPAFDPELDRAERVQRAEAAAEQLVSTTFVLPILEEMHKSSFAAGPFAPGVGEKRFTPLLDQHLADRIVKYGRFPLVDSLRDHLLGRGVKA